MSRVIALAACLFALTIPGTAAQSDVRVVVSADRAFVPIGDLKADDFEVRESGVARTVTAALPVTRPSRLVLIIDDTAGIRPQLGQIRAALRRFVDSLDATCELLIVTVSGTIQVRSTPMLDRAPARQAIERLFGLPGAMPMIRAIDEAFHRFATPSDRRPVYVVVTTEDFESTDEINQQEIDHVTRHFKAGLGVLHAVRLIVPASVRVTGTGPLTELPVSLMVARDTGGSVAATSSSGLDAALQRLADTINGAEVDAGVYELRYQTGGSSRNRGSALQVRTTRPGVTINVLLARIR